MPPDEKRFTQAEVNGLVARAKKEWEAERAKLLKEVADRDTIVAAARARIEELEPTASALEAERAAHAQTVQKHRAYHRDLTLTKAMEDSRCFKPGLRHAMHFFAEEFEIHEDEAGAITGATRKADGKRFEGLQKATEAYLRDNPHLLSGGKLPVGGGTIPPWGNPHPRATPFPTVADPTRHNPVDMINRGLKSPETKSQ